MAGEAGLESEKWGTLSPLIITQVPLAKTVSGHLPKGIQSSHKPPADPDGPRLTWQAKANTMAVSKLQRAEARVGRPAA